MTRVNEAFPSQYIKAVDLQGRSVPVVIDKVKIEEVGQDQDEKPVCYFQHKDRGLVLNRTNAMMIASRYGDEMDNWHGKEITLYPDKVSFQGRIVDAIRVRLPDLPEAEPGEIDTDDDIPF